MIKIFNFLKITYNSIVIIGFIALLNPSCASPSKKSIVKNKRPTPTFSIPDKIPGQNYIYYIGLGDQGNGGSAQKHVATLMNAKAKKDSLHFVLTLGDNFYDDGVKSVKDRQWQKRFEKMYDLPYLNVPFYASLGNHDHHKNRSRFQVEYSALSKKWNMPEPYYTFVKKIDSTTTIQFFALDSDIIAVNKKGASIQINWLESELQNSTARWKVVYGHHPVFSYGHHGDEKRMIDLIRPILEKYEVDLYLSGHDHDRQLIQPLNGVHYIVSGTGSKSRDTQYGQTTIFAATNLGFAWFRTSANDFHVQFINGDGEIEFAYTWEKDTVVKQ